LALLAFDIADRLSPAFDEVNQLLPAPCKALEFLAPLYVEPFPFSFSLPSKERGYRRSLSSLN